MQLPAFDYVRGESLEQVLGLLGQYRAHARVLAGGTDLILTLRQRLFPAERLSPPELVIGIGGLAELQQVDVTEDGTLRLGAGCTLTALATHPFLQARFPALAAAFRSIGSLHIRNVATLGGNLNLPTRCWYTNQSEPWRQTRAPCLKTGGDICHAIRNATECYALNSVDSAPALIALGARVVLTRASGSRQLRLADFYRDDGLRPTVLEPDELVTAVEVPPHGGRTAYLKIAQRTGLDFALGTIAAAVTGSNRRPGSVRLVLGSVASRPVSLAGAARIVEQGGLRAETIEAAADSARNDLGEITSLFSPAGYKRRLVRTLVSRVLHTVRRQQMAVSTPA